MPLNRLLIANRGEIAIRIARAAAELGLPSVSVYSEDDHQCSHIRKADDAVALRGRGAAAYLDQEQIIDIAKRSNCDCIHPGYGFLSENAEFASRCLEEGLTFVGPLPETIALLGDKSRARTLAAELGVPILPGTEGPTTLAQAGIFFEELSSGQAMVIKAIAGGGGRGMRVVRPGDDLDALYKSCQSEAEKAFGNGDVYVETYLPRVRHIEVQIVGDGKGQVSHLWERECSLQRRHQKLVEIAPAPRLDPSLRENLLEAALRLAQSVNYKNLGTFEFLVDAGEGSPSRGSGEVGYFFIEANPRLQVEHTVTEEITGLDLVQAQLEIAGGRGVDELKLVQADIPKPEGYALQLRVNMEKMGADGSVSPMGGTIRIFEPPLGRNIRTDSFGYAGYRTSPHYDSLLAKVVCHSSSSDFTKVLQNSDRALSEFRIVGVETNRAFLKSLIQHPSVADWNIYTGFLDDHMEQIVDADQRQRDLYFEAEPNSVNDAPVSGAARGGKVDPNDPLGVLNYGQRLDLPDISDNQAVEEGDEAILSQMQGTIVSVVVEPNDLVYQGQVLLIMEAMKMEHVISAPFAGLVKSIAVGDGDTVLDGQSLIVLEKRESDQAQEQQIKEIDLDHIRPDLQEVVDRHFIGLDEGRPDAVAKRRKTGQRTARENVEDLCDPGTYREYGALAIAAQRKRRDLQDLIEKTPADGMVAGVGRVNGQLFDEKSSECVVMSYDYTVLAGTQGHQNHNKKDRMFELAERMQLPVVVFTEGGGGRPGDTDGIGFAQLHCMAFHLFGRLSGLVPLVGINSGRCFAGNAALLGCCDVVIATENSNIGMGGPAMIEGGGLGIFRPEEVGPMSDQVPNGVVDIAVKDEAEGVAVAKKYLSYFQGEVDGWTCTDQRLLRTLIPENRLRIYDVRDVLNAMADTDSVLELRAGFGLGMITAFARIEGRPVGVIANNPTHLAGAIDAPGADKAVRFMQLCDAFDIPIVFLCDTPGIMVGPESEKTGTVRHASRMFVTGSNLSVPFCTIVLRKGYGLGAQAMAGGSFRAPVFTIAWPTGEFGGMGFEGAIKLAFRRELEAEKDPDKRLEIFNRRVARMYENGKALSMASHYEIDAVIDPVETRSWIMKALTSAPIPAPRNGKKLPYIDTW